MSITVRMTMAVIAVVVASGCDNNEASVTGPSPVAPSISSLTPDSAVAGSSDLMVTLTGTNFVNSSRFSSGVKWFANGVKTGLATRFVSVTEITAVIPAALLKDARTAHVFVENIDVSNGSATSSRSNGFPFLVRTSGEGVYQATFVAATSCAAELPTSARERTYTATLLVDGSIQWTGPTLNPPQGHRPVSSGSLVGDVFAFSVDFERDPLSDDFHGIWDDMGNGTYLNISGKGIGERHDLEITGTLDGLFAYYETVAPPPAGRVVGHYCRASDHRFTFVKQ